MQLVGGSLKENYGKKMKFSTLMRSVTVLHLLTIARNQKVFDYILKLLPAGL